MLSSLTGATGGDQVHGVEVREGHWGFVAGCVGSLDVSIALVQHLGVPGLALHVVVEPREGVFQLAMVYTPPPPGQTPEPLGSGRTVIVQARIHEMNDFRFTV